MVQGAITQQTMWEAAPHEEGGCGQSVEYWIFNGSLHTAVQCILCSKAVFVVFFCFVFFVAQVIAMLAKNCRDITLPTMFHLVKAMVFPVVMYGCESWTIKKEELMLLNCGIGEDS